MIGNTCPACGETLEFEEVLDVLEGGDCNRCGAQLHAEIIEVALTEEEEDE